MTPFDELQREHEQLLESADAVEATAVAAYIDRARTAAAQIGDPRERDQLRANLRYWASYVYDRSGTYPTTTLLPSAMAKSIGAPTRPEPIIENAVPVRRKSWPWLIGVALVALLAVALLSQLQLARPDPALAVPTSTIQPSGGGGVTQRLWPLPGTTDLYDKPATDPAAQVFGRMQAGSQFYAIARTADAQWLKITTADEVSGWIRADASGLKADQLKQLPAASVIVSTLTPTSTPIATMTAAAGGQPGVTVPPPTPTRVAVRATPTPVGQKPATPTGAVPPAQSVPLRVDYQIVTSGPSPFNPDAWVIVVQLLAAGGDNHYVFWVNGQRLDGDRYTIDGVACRAVTVTFGATSGGQAVRREVTLKSPLTTCK